MHTQTSRCTRGGHATNGRGNGVDDNVWLCVLIYLPLRKKNNNIYPRPTTTENGSVVFSCRVRTTICVYKTEYEPRPARAHTRTHTRPRASPSFVGYFCKVFRGVLTTAAIRRLVTRATDTRIILIIIWYYCIIIGIQQ